MTNEYRNLTTDLATYLKAQSLQAAGVQLLHLLWT